jgi:hypothetical protein
MALSNTEIIKFMIDNSAGVDIDELFKHIWNIKYNERINVNDEGEINVEEEEIPVEEKEEIPVETPKNKERIMCNECNIPILKIGKNRHYKTKKHLKNTEINNEKQAEETKLMELEDININEIQKQAEETKLMELEDININEIPPPIPDEVPEYKKSKHYLYDETDEKPDEDGYIMYRIFYDTDISDEELLKYLPDLRNDKYLFIKYRSGYKSVYWPINIDKPAPIQEQKFGYSEEEMEDINEKWHCKLCNTTIHRIQRNKHFKDLWHIYKRELRKKNENAVRPPDDYRSDEIPEIEGLNYCYCCRLYFQEEKQVHLNSEDHITMMKFNRNF